MCGVVFTAICSENNILFITVQHPFLLKSKSDLLNMSLFHSMNCISEPMPRDCTNPKLKVSASVHDSNVVKYIPSATESHKMFGKAQNFQSQKSLYISKACKYSFIASDYTSPDGQKLLNIKVYQNPPENGTQKVKNFPSKRSISEYFLSKNAVEKDSQDDVRKENVSLKSCHRSFFKNQISFTSPIEQQSSSLNCATTSDAVQISPKNSFILQHQKNCSDADGCFSGKSENLEEKNCASGILADKSSNKNYNSNPSVNCRVFDIESLTEVGDSFDNTSGENNAQFGVDDAWFIPSAKHTFSSAEISGSASAAQLSIASSFGDSNLPTCKICHTAAKPEDSLISPCRCTGTLRYIHCGCLMKWLEICNKRSRKPPTCELCKYQFHWHKKFKVGQWQFPHCSGQDKILHTVFLLSVLIMIGCAIVTILCFKQHKGVKTEITHLELTQSEIITLICGALFFLSFFLAMYVEIKARNTIYKLLLKFVYLNQQWYIDEYDRNKENSVAIDV